MSDFARGHGLLLPFDTDDEQFVRGFEAGRLWEMLKRGEPFDQAFHASNAEMVLRMAEATEMPHRAEQVGGEWMHGFFGDGWEEAQDV